MARTSSTSINPEASEDVLEVLGAVCFEEDQKNESPQAQDEAVRWMPVFLLGFLSSRGEKAETVVNKSVYSSPALIVLSLKPPHALSLCVPLCRLTHTDTKIHTKAGGRAHQYTSPVLCLSHSLPHHHFVYDYTFKSQPY